MIFVTGGTGLLGAQVLRQLVTQGEKVRALYRLTSSFNLVNDIVDQVEWVEGNVLDIPALEKAMNGVTHIYHCAGLVAFHPGVHKKLMDVNFEGTANIVNIAVDYDIEKLVHVSSTAALGEPEMDEAIDEEVSWQNRRFSSQYALSKFLGEREVWRGVGEGLNAVIVNPSIVLGAGNWTTDSSAFFGQVWKGLKFYPVGTNGFVDVKDVADAMIQLMKSDMHTERFILSADNWTYYQLLEHIAQTLGQYPPRIPATFLLREIGWRLAALQSYFTGQPPLITKETVRSSAQHRTYNNRKIRQTLDMEFTSLERTIERTGKQFLEQVNKE